MQQQLKHTIKILKIFENLINKRLDYNKRSFENEKAFIESIIYGDCEGKWYEYDTIMKTFSEAIGDKEIILKGVGEEIDDQWIKTYKNGLVISHKVAKIIFEETM